MKHDWIRLSWSVFFIFYILTPFAKATSGVRNQDTWFYFRCNATSWDLNDATRLQQGPVDYVYELVFEIHSPEILASGDDCVITETPAKNSWGDWNRSYGGQGSNLTAPDSAVLRPQTDAKENVYFKVRYPSFGRYRFILNSRDSYVSIRKEVPGTLGEAVWTLPGQMAMDSFGQVFLNSYPPESSLALLDTPSGLPSWSYRSNSYLAVANSCTSQQVLYTSEKDRILARSSSNGREIWVNDFNGGLQDRYPILQCFSRSQGIFASYGVDQTTIIKFNREFGYSHWSWTAPGVTALMGTDGKHFFATSYDGASTTLFGLDHETGAMLWQLEQKKGYFVLDNDGKPYFIDGHVVAQIDPLTGKKVWIRSGKQDDYFWLSFEQGNLFLHEKTRISSLNRNNGKTIWTYAYSPMADKYPSEQILKSGILVIRSNDYPNNLSRQTAVNSSNGKIIWERTSNSTNSYLIEDAQNAMWLIDGKNLSSVNPSTGSILWTFRLEFENQLAYILNVLESDASRVYVSYGVYDSKNSPMGILALDKAHGGLVWQRWLGTSLSFVGSDSSRLYLNVAPGYSRGIAQALAK
ncbi:MAG: PQQ-binding-like beta-propeller repeat protein [Proteobacteria bacterium]|nr:PQQ-binding-like beta-propeller repeat protein [Pseudomonadota bacterium]